MINKWRFFSLLVLVFGCQLSAQAADITPSPSPLQVQTWRLPSGSQVYFQPIADLPIVDVRLIFDAGSARDGQALGLAALTNRLLSEGTHKADADAIAQQFEQLGVQFSQNTTRDEANLAIRSLSQLDKLLPAVELLATLAGDSVFPEQAFKRVQQEHLRTVAYQQQSPGVIASQLLYQAIYADAPYAYPVIGTTESIAKLSLDAVKTFYQRYYVQANTKIIIVGKVTREQAEAMAQTLSAQMAVGQPAQPLAAIAISETGQKLAQAFPSSQTHIRLGMLSIQPGDPNYPALFVGNHILGGSGLVSLLFDELRQKNGLVYNVNSSVTPLAANGVFAIGMSTKADQAGKALHLARQTLSDFLQSGPSEAQLLAAKQNILGSFPLRLDSNANITHYISLLARYNLPMDYLDTFQQRLAALSADSVKTAMNQSIKLKQLTEVQVGPQGEKSR